MPADAVELTLRLDAQTAAALQRRADARGQSAAEVAAEILRALAAEVPDGPAPEGDWKAQLAPIARRLASRKPPAREVTEEDYWRHLEEKHR